MWKGEEEQKAERAIDNIILKCVADQEEDVLQVDKELVERGESPGGRISSFE